MTSAAELGVNGLEADFNGRLDPLGVHSEHLFPEDPATEALW
jgi:hypothetical protein